MLGHEVTADEVDQALGCAAGDGGRGSRGRMYAVEPGGAGQSADAPLAALSTQSAQVRGQAAGPVAALLGRVFGGDDRGQLSVGLLAFRGRAVTPGVIARGTDLQQRAGAP